MRNWIDLDGKLVLQLLTDHSGMTWNELSEAAGLSRLHARGDMQLYNCLQSLADQELLTIDGVPDSLVARALHDCLQGEWHLDSLPPLDRRSLRFRASPRWARIQMALNMKWLGVPSATSGFSMLVEPLFGAPISLPSKSDVFVVMPFAESFQPVYRDHIRAVTTKLNLSCSRADDLFTSRDLMTDVWSSICGAGVVVADCTDRNPNVFYEMGLAHTVGKPVILITQSADDIPADIRSIRYIRYAYTPRGMQEFEETLAKTIKTTMDLYS